MYKLGMFDGALHTTRVIMPSCRVASPDTCGMLGTVGASRPPSKSMWVGAAVGAAGMAVAAAGMAVAPAAGPLAALPLLAEAAGEDSLMLPREAAMLALTLTSDSFLGPLVSGAEGEGRGRVWGGFAGMESLLGESGTGVSFFKASMRALVACTASSVWHDDCSDILPAAFVAI